MASIPSNAKPAPLSPCLDHGLRSRAPNFILCIGTCEEPPSHSRLFQTKIHPILGGSSSRAAQGPHSNLSNRCRQSVAATRVHLWSRPQTPLFPATRAPSWLSPRQEPQLLNWNMLRQGPAPRSGICQPAAGVLPMRRVSPSDGTRALSGLRPATIPPPNGQTC